MPAMAAAAWTVCTIWLAAALGVALWRGVAALRRGQARAALTRSRSPAVLMFAAYLLVAALVTPLSVGESTSPLLWLALALPVAHTASAFASGADAHPHLLTRIALALLFGGAFLASAALILALVSPAFVPAWLR